MTTYTNNTRPVIGREEPTKPGLYHFTAEDLVRIRGRLFEIIEAGECETSFDATNPRFVDAIATNATAGNAELVVGRLKVIDRECITGTTTEVLQVDGTEASSSICWNGGNGQFGLIGAQVIIRRDKADWAEIAVVKTNDMPDFLQVRVSLEPIHFDIVLHAIEKASDDESEAKQFPACILLGVMNFLHDDGKLVDGVSYIKAIQAGGIYEVCISN